MGRPETVLRRAANEISKIRGVNVFGTMPWPGAGPVNSKMSFDPNPRWDSDDFFTATSPEMITIPANLGGRYFIHAVVMWSRAGNGLFTVGQRDGTPAHPPSERGYFAAVIEVNGAVPVPRQNLTVDAVVAHAHRTTQQLCWETDLSDGDTLDLELTQWVLGVDPNLQPGTDTLAVEADLTVRRLGISA